MEYLKAVSCPNDSNALTADTLAGAGIAFASRFHVHALPLLLLVDGWLSGTPSGTALSFRRTPKSCDDG